MDNLTVKFLLNCVPRNTDSYFLNEAELIVSFFVQRRENVTCSFFTLYFFKITFHRSYV